MIREAYTRLTGENPEKGGHYFTVWAPRQSGKTWTIQQILSQLKKDERFDTLVVNLERLKDEKKVGHVLDTIAGKIGEGLGKKFSRVNTQNKFQEIFKNGVIHKPLILVLDEVDALEETAINTLASAFRSIFIDRSYEMEKNTDQRSYLLHSAASWASKMRKVPLSMCSAAFTYPTFHSRK